MSHDETVQASHNGQQAADVASSPDPEVVPNTERRRFTTEYKLRVLTEADACTKPGEIGALLRREELYRAPGQVAHSTADGDVEALTPQRRAPRLIL